MTTSSYGLGRDFNAPIAFPEAVLTLRAVSPAVWDALPPDVLVAERQAELAVARLLAGAREAAEADDWEVIGRLLAEAKVRYAAFPWVIEVLEGGGGGHSPLSQGGLVFRQQDEQSPGGEATDFSAGQRCASAFLPALEEIPGQGGAGRADLRAPARGAGRTPELAARQGE